MTLIAEREGDPLGGNVVVRCRAGHLFTTIWVPGTSFKSIRLGWMRRQYRPVGRHCTVVVPARDEELTPAERAEADANRDVRIPGVPAQRFAPTVRRPGDRTPRRGRCA